MTAAVVPISLLTVQQATLAGPSERQHRAGPVQTPRLMGDSIVQAISKMWEGHTPERFETGDCLEWAVAIHGCLPGSLLRFIMEPLSNPKVGQTVKSHLVVDVHDELFDCRGRHSLQKWNWDLNTALIMTVSPEIIRGITIGVPLVFPGHPCMSRDNPFNEKLAASVAQEFLLHYATPTPLAQHLHAHPGAM